MFAMWRMFAKDKIIWDKVFNNGLSKIYGRQLYKI